MMNDKEIRDRLVALDEDEDTQVTSWVAEFIENLAFSNRTLSELQRSKAEEILQDYGF